MRAIRVLAAAGVAFAVFPVSPLRAAPRNPKISSVVQVSCGSVPCTKGAHITQGALTGGTIDVSVAAEADLGLEWVRLEAQNPGDPRWYCVEFWEAGRATTFSETRRWRTAHWTDPRKQQCEEGDCSHCIENSPHHHGAPTVNTSLSLRVVAREQGASLSNTPDAVSPPFALKIQNAPEPARWLQAPEASTRNGAPAVILRWAPNREEQAVPPEPAVVPGSVREYRFLRTDPSGARTAFAVNAAHPERQGCARVSNIAYECADSALPATGGSFRYAVAAVVAGVEGDACGTASGTCVIGPLSAFESVSVPASAAQPTPTGTTTANAGFTPSSSGSPAPISVPTEGLASAPKGDKTRGGAPILPIAAASAAILGLAITALRARVRRAG